MRESFDAKLITSFYLWLDYVILSKGRGFVNISSDFYRTAETQLPFYSYSSPYKSFVYDSSISGANIMTGISGSNGFIPRGTSGIKIDYYNGRILTNQGLVSNFSGSYSLREFNIYLQNDDEASIIFQNRYKYNPEFGNSYSGSVPKEVYLPGIFLNLPDSKNVPFAFGGEDDTKSTIRLTIINDKYNKNIDLISLLKDQCQSYFPILSISDTPLDKYGDLKTGYYNYEHLRNSAQENGNQLVRIEYVAASTLNDKTVRARGEVVNFVEFDLSVLRYPRQYYNT